MVKVLDIFSGGGGSSYGAAKAGAEIVCGIDMDPVAIENFRHNFPNAIGITKRLEGVRLKQLREKIGDIDLLLASPECTNHTCAKGSAPRSEESRATALQALRFARYFKPRWIVLENVVHMRPWSRYGELKEKLEAEGYKLKELILDASEFGVPQKRRRLFLVGDREAVPNRPATSSNQDTLNVADIIDRSGSWKTTALYRDGRALATIERAERAISALGENRPFLIVYYGTDGCGGWQGIDRPLRTITTVDRFAFVDPTKGEHRMRMLQVPELQKAMGLGEDYEFIAGTRRDRVRILGNGVCPPVMEAITTSITVN